MTYEELYLTALSELQSGKISYPEYEQMIEPLKEEIKVPANGKKIDPLNDEAIRVDERKRIAEHLRSFVCRENCGERRCVDKMDECVWVGYIDEFFGEYEKEQK